MSLSKLKWVLCLLVLSVYASTAVYAETEAEILEGYQSYRLHGFTENDYASFKEAAHVREYLEEGNSSDCIQVTGGQLYIASANRGYCGVKFITADGQDWAVRFDLTLNKGNACFSVYDGEAGVAVTLNEAWMMIARQAEGTGICGKDRTVTTELGRAYTYIIKARDGQVSMYRRASGTLRYQCLAENLSMRSSGEEHGVNIYADAVVSGFSVDNLELFGTSSNFATIDDTAFVSDEDGITFDMSVVSGVDGYVFLAFYAEDNLKWCEVQPITAGKTWIHFEDMPAELKEICDDCTLLIWDKNMKPCYDKQKFLMTEL